MWLSLLCLAVALAVATKVSTQGAFGAFLMLVLTICCAAAIVTRSVGKAVSAPAAVPLGESSFQD